jgi:hypothetical protein
VDTTLNNVAEPGGNAAPSNAAPTLEEPFAQELRVQIRQVKAQKAEAEAALAQTRELASAREQELLENARAAASQADQQREALEEVRSILAYCTVTSIIM